MMAVCLPDVEVVSAGAYEALCLRKYASAPWPQGLLKAWRSEARVV